MLSPFHSKWVASEIQSWMCQETRLTLQPKVARIFYESLGPSLFRSLVHSNYGQKERDGSLLVLFKPPALAGTGSEESFAGFVRRCSPSILAYAS
jgi:hypothetical protein